MIRTPFRALATVAVALLLGSGIAVSGATAASAENLNVSATCGTLTVKPNGFAAKGEVRVVVDGEVQTDGTDDGWRSFKGSFSGVYNFDPVVAHDYKVEINSFGADSAGIVFESGTGYDETFSGPTNACAPVEVRAAASNCVSLTALDKQSIDLTFSNLRKSVTYLSEVVLDGTVVKHFQFRTSPVVTKTFTQLTAGETYEVRLTDQTDDSLSRSLAVSIPACATKVAVDAAIQQCAIVGGTASISAELSGLAQGRSYTASIATGVRSSIERSVQGDNGDQTVRFDALQPGRDYTVIVTDDDAPRQTSFGPLTAADCPAPAGGNPAGSGGAGNNPAGGSGAGSAGGVSTNAMSSLPAQHPAAHRSAQSLSGASAVVAQDEGTPAVTTPNGSAGSEAQLETLAEGAPAEATGGPASGQPASSNAWASSAPALITIAIVVFVLLLGLFMALAWRKRQNEV